LVYNFIEFSKHLGNQYAPGKITIFIDTFIKKNYKVINRIKNRCNAFRISKSRKLKIQLSTVVNKNIFDFLV